MDYEKLLAELFSCEIATMVEADEIDETEESNFLLAREAARPLLAELDDEPLYVAEAQDGAHIVAGARQAFLIGPNGTYAKSLDGPMPEVEDDEDLDEKCKTTSGKHAKKKMAKKEYESYPDEDRLTIEDVDYLRLESGDLLLVEVGQAHSCHGCSKFGSNHPSCADSVAVGKKHGGKQLDIWLKDSMKTNTCSFFKGLGESLEEEMETACAPPVRAVQEGLSVDYGSVTIRLCKYDLIKYPMREPGEVDKAHTAEAQEAADDALILAAIEAKPAFMKAVRENLKANTTLAKFGLTIRECEDMAALETALVEEVTGRIAMGGGSSAVPKMVIDEMNWFDAAHQDLDYEAAVGHAENIVQMLELDESLIPIPSIGKNPKTPHDTGPGVRGKGKSASGPKLDSEEPDEDDEEIDEATLWADGSNKTVKKGQQVKASQNYPTVDMDGKDVTVKKGAKGKVTYVGSQGEVHVKWANGKETTDIMNAEYTAYVVRESEEAEAEEGTPSDFRRALPENFSKDTDDWFDALSAKPSKDPAVAALLKIVKGKPGEGALRKFAAGVAKIKDKKVAKPLQAFVKGITGGKYSKEFKKLVGAHSQTSELFSLFRQAATYNESAEGDHADFSPEGLDEVVPGKARYWVYTFDASANKGVRVGAENNLKKAAAVLKKQPNKGAGGWVFDRQTKVKLDAKGNVIESVDEAGGGMTMTLQGREIKEPTFMKSMATKAGVALKRALRLWGKAQFATEDQYPDVKKKSPRYYEIVTGIFKKMLKISEHLDLDAWIADLSDEDWTGIIEQEKPNGNGADSDDPDDDDDDDDEEDDDDDDDGKSKPKATVTTGSVKKSKSAVNYQPQSKSKKCKACTFWLGGTCSQVKGKIKADGTCDLWQKKVKAESDNLSLMRFRLHETSPDVLRKLKDLGLDFDTPTRVQDGKLELDVPSEIGRRIRPFMEDIAEVVEVLQE